MSSQSLQLSPTVESVRQALTSHPQASTMAVVQAILERHLSDYASNALHLELHKNRNS